ncbi:arginyltransferase 1 isoform X2 [Leptinotarsa decemlineata]|uniref:arginyltransferase 1 isoform X2 n=1 Tax=Leptinotarsa decemlineata TaxID=7539 RepID=UPI003D307C71
MSLNEISCVQWFEGIEKHRCGYCKKENSSISHGMWAETLTVQDYQDLIDRGWRRSGKYCYKPVMDETCCPQYTIKCDVSNFSLSKSQKKVVKKFNKFLEDNNLNKKETTAEEQSADGCGNSEIFMKDGPDIKITDVPSIVANHVREVISCTSGVQNIDREDRNKPKEETCDILDNESSLPAKTDKSKTLVSKGQGADLNRPPLKKAKLLRMERKKEKLLKKGLALEKNDPQSKKSLEDFLKEISPDSQNKFQMRLISTSEPTPDWERVEYELYKQYQMGIHNDPPSKLSYAGFRRFLVNTPLKPEEFPNGIEGPGYGSFHQQYWINDKLVAVGVIDILPRCVSSVYFFYDPQYRNLVLGTYGSLREVQFTKSLCHTLPDINSYYMGFYIHSCPKMRYKGKLTPSFLLCPETYCWIPIEKCIEKLDAQKYSRLNEDLDALDRNIPSRKEVLDMKVIYRRKLIYFRDFKQYCEDPNLFHQIGVLVGKTGCRNILFWEK